MLFENSYIYHFHGGDKIIMLCELGGGQLPDFILQESMAEIAHVQGKLLINPGIFEYISDGHDINAPHIYYTFLSVNSVNAGFDK